MSIEGSDELETTMRRHLEAELEARAAASLRPQRGRSSGCVADAPPAEEQARVRWRRDIAALASTALKIPLDRLDMRENMSRYGVDSILVTEIMKHVSDRLDAPIAPTVFFEAKHLEGLADILFDRYRHRVEASLASVRDTAPEMVENIESFETDGLDVEIDPEIACWLDRYRSLGEEDESGPEESHNARCSRGDTFEPVAIVAMEGVFPESPDLATFEAHLAAGHDCIREVPPERWDWRRVFGDPKQGEFTNVKHGGFAPDIDTFDPLFFGISPREAELMDPQHRLFIQCVWKLIEAAGYAPRSLAGRKVGIFMGVNLQDYAHLIDRSDEVEALHLTSLGHMFCPNRLSFLLDVHGPSQVIDTACSSSLVALHRAVLAVSHEGCEMAIAGGANLLISPDMHIMYSKVGILSEDGRCKTFSPQANGYVRSDGIGAVLVKTLARAEADGDPVLAVIRGSAENHGGMATSLTAPNARAQANVVVEAHRRAGIDPRSIGYIECHGTGTALGDPIEINGLKLAFEELLGAAGVDGPEAPFCGLGSVKSSIGHAETAAGVAGLIKAVLSVRRGRLYSTLHCLEINPLIDLAGSPFFIVQQGRAWPRPVVEGREEPRRAGISSFGAGGSNAHVLIEEYVGDPTHRPAVVGPVLIVLSARTSEQLGEIVVGLARFLSETTFALQHIAYTLQVGRDALQERLAIVAGSLDDLREALARIVAGDDAGCARGRVARNRDVSPDDAEAVRRCWEARDWARLGSLWVAGASVDWGALYAETAGATRLRRLSLPTYPFAKQRYWVPQPGGPVSDRRREFSPLHPLLGENTSDLGELRFTARFCGSEFFLAHHVVRGEKVLPGAAYLEMARAAVAEMSGADPHGPARLKNVVWARPYIAEADPKPLHIALKPEPSGEVSYRIYTTGFGGEPVLHAQGLALPAGGENPSARVDPLALRTSVTAGREQELCLDGTQCYDVLRAMGMDYGPAHRGLEKVYFSPPGASPQVLALVSLPASLAARARTYVLHPAVLDSALQACIGLVAAARYPQPLAAAAGEAAASLPFALDELVLLAPPPQTLWVHIRGAATRDARLEKLDIDLIGAEGAVCVRLRGFCSRAPEPVLSAADAALVVCQPVWRPRPATVSAPPLGWSQHRIVICDWDRRFPASLEVEIARLLPRAQCIRLSLPNPIEVGFGEAVYATFETIRSVPASNAAGSMLLQALVPADGDGALLGGLSGLLQTARRENSWFYGQLVACDREAASDGLALKLVQDSTRCGDAQIRHRAAGRDVLCWEERTGSAPRILVPWKDDGVYLVTGGAGGLGRLFARHIARSASRATVVLCGRSFRDDTALQELRTLGLTVCYRRADVARPAEVEALVAEIITTHGRLDGVLHAAGLLRDTFIHNKTAEEIAAVLAPKVAGVLNLDRATSALGLDVFLLFSSAAGAWGSAGQADYAAANAFLDAFAHVRNARVARGERHGRTISIDWPLWADGGMRMEPNALVLMRQTTGMVALPEAEGLRAFCEIVASDEVQAMPLYGAPERLRRLLMERDESPAASMPTSAPARKPGALEPAGSDLSGKITRRLMQAVASLMKFDLRDVEAEGEWNDYGFDSITLTDFANRLNQSYNLDLTPTVFFEYPTIAALATRLASEHGAAFAEILGRGPAPAPIPKPARAAPAAAEVLEPVQNGPGAEAVAIIGVSGRFPMARDVEEFWDNLASSKDCIGEIPPDRWDWRAIYGDPRDGNRTRVKWGGFIDGVGDFDAAFFGVSPREAQSMEPSQRLLLQHVWTAIEDAGYPPTSFAGSNTGVFIGTAPTGYGELMARAGTAFESQSSTGVVGSIGPNRVSYFLDLHGPSEPIETACSSALVAIHRGLTAIASGECEQAIVGGVNLLVSKETQISFDKAGMLSSDGRCKAFSKQANGYVRGEAVGVLLLKKLAAVQRDGDHVYAVIRGSGMNHGGRAKSLTAPNPRAQADLLRATYERAGIDPRSVGYIEAHGTGTELGDPIEIVGLKTAFQDLYRAVGVPEATEPHIGIGSVKTNVGHAELAAGVVGVIKVLLQLEHKTLVPSLHCADVNPYIRLDGSPFYLVRDKREWAPPRDAQGRALPRRAGVSSFGFGGVNAHLVLEEYPERRKTPPADLPALVVLSARDMERLVASSEALRAFVGKSAAPEQGAAATLAARIGGLIAEILGVDSDEIDAATPLEELGFDPVHRAMLQSRLQEVLGSELGARPFVRSRTIEETATAILEAQPALAEKLVGSAAPRPTQRRRVNLIDLAYTLQVGREAMDARLGIVAGSVEDLEEKLAAFVEGRAQDVSGLYVGSAKADKDLVSTLAEDEFQEALAKWIVRGKFTRLLELWVKGLEVDWRRLYGETGPYGLTPHRISAPGYPFKQKRYWVEPRPTAGPSAAILHPLLHENISTLERVAFRTRLGGDEFFLADHRVEGQKVLPGAAYLEMARAAATKVQGEAEPAQGVLRLRDVVWIRPVLVQEPTELELEFDRGAGGALRYRIVSGQAADRVVHSEGASTRIAIAAPSRIDTAAILARPDLVRVGGGTIYQMFRAAGLDYGPAHQAIEELHAGDGLVLAKLVLPAPVAETRDTFVLHPSLVDAALQACIGLNPNPDSDVPAKLALPFAVDGVDVFRSCTTAMWAVVRPSMGTAPHGRVRKLDIDLADASGDVCIAIRGFSARVRDDAGGRRRLSEPSAAVVMPNATSVPAEPDQAALKAHTTEYFEDLLAKTLRLGRDEIRADTSFESYGVDSMLIMEMTAALELHFGAVSKTLFFEYRTIEDLVEPFVEAHRARLMDLFSGDASARVTESVTSDIRPDYTANSAHAHTKNVSPSAERAGTDIAIIGISGRYPMAHDIEEFWVNLREGRDCITEVPADRWDWRAYHSEDGSAPGRHICKWGGFVPDADRFDPLFFNISPSTAEYMDPQERLFLEHAFAALEDSGYRREDLQHLAEDDDLPAQVGVYAGVMYGEYQLIARDACREGRGFAAANFYASIANRVSYALNLHGPSMSVDTMCSSSLTAIHLACQDLNLGRTRLALAGGVNLNLHPNKYDVLSNGQFISSRGKCESFGAGGDGYVPSEGVGVAVLKRLAEAERDGDHIYGVIKGSALNHGGRTNGFSVPNPNAQRTAIQRALREAGVDPRAIGYFEAHGTGTKLGDPIEIAGLGKALAPYAEPGRIRWIGSCKSNIGHCEAAAGIAGVTKVLLQMREGQIAPSLHAETLNPYIDFDTTSLRVNRALRAWPRPEIDGRPARRVAGVSSFGAGGSNAHLLIEEYIPPERPVAHDRRRPFVFVLSARTEPQLRDYAESLSRFVSRHAPKTTSAAWLRDMAYTLQVGRESMQYRLAFTSAGVEDLAGKLVRFLEGDPTGLHVGRVGAGGGGTNVEVAQLAAQGRSDELAAHWAAGATIDWRALYPTDGTPARMSLPTYPFARERYWIDGQGTRGEAATAPKQVADDPAMERGGNVLLYRPRWCNSGQRQAPDPEGFAEHRIVCVDPLPPIPGATTTRLVSQSGEIDGCYTDYAVQLFELIREILLGKPKDRVLLQLVTGAGAGRSPCPDEVVQALGTMLKTAQQENPRLVGQTIAFDDGLPGSAELARLLTEEARSGEDRPIRYRDGRREVLGWVPVTDAEAPRAMWKEGGVYLVTGGAGGLGLIFAEEIARQVRGVTLILTGRTPLDAARAARMNALRSMGARIDYRLVDVAERAGVAALVAAIGRDHGPLNGIIHSAGIIRDNFILRKTSADVREVFAAKVSGLANLDKATRALDLDFLVVFGSLAGVAGNPGQADYAAANAFMDAYAAHLNAVAGRRRVLSVDWPLWETGGMDVAPQVKDAMWRNIGLRPLSTEAGLRAFHRALVGDMDRMLVLEGDVTRLRTLFADDMVLSAAEAPAMVQSAPTTDRLRAETEGLVKRVVSETLKLPVHRIESDIPLEEYGVDSVVMAKLVAEIEMHIGPVSKTLFFEYPTIGAVSDHLVEACHGPLAALFPAAAVETTASLSAPAIAPASPPAPTPAVVAERDIAVIGMAGRFPGAPTLDDFWDVLANGRDCISEVPATRWDHALYYDPDRTKLGKTYCKWGGFLDEVDRFDDRFFRIRPDEAELLDPQEKLFLETVWNLLESTGCLGETLRHQAQSKVGVFVGSMSQQHHAFRSDIARESLVVLSSPSSIANRVSFFFDLHGPSIAVDTMCSSAFVALHMACESLLRSECRIAIAGGVNVTIHPKKYIGLSLGGIVGGHPNSRSFGDGDGYLPAEGVGAVLLKPLSAAIADGDEILGVVKSTAINHAGRSSGYRAPNATAQADLVAENCASAGIDPRTISYVESAANGSPVGDSIEVTALTAAFRRFTTDECFCAIGSVKSNIGHAEAASGMSQLVKVLLQLRHGQLAPTIKAEPLNPEIDFEGTPFVLQRRLEPWRRPILALGEESPHEFPRRASISALGLGGSGAHVIVEEYVGSPQPRESRVPDARQLILLSARTENQLTAVVRRTLAFVERSPDLSLDALAYTLQTGRETMDFRVAFVVTGRAQLAATLGAILRDGWATKSAARIYFGSVDEDASDVRQLASGATGEAMIRLLLGEKDLDKLAFYWAKGVKIQWWSLWGAARPRRLALPTYPFDRQSHWLPDRSSAIETGEIRPVAPERFTPDPARPARINMEHYLVHLAGAEKDPVAANRTFAEHGLDSIATAGLRRDFEILFGVRLTARDLATYPTPAALAAFAAGQDAIFAGRNVPEPPPAPVPTWPLSEGQKGLYALHSFAPRTSAYNVPLALRFHEGFEIARFERACDNMLRQFPDLATLFVERDGELRQTRHVDPVLTFVHEDLAEADEAEIVARLRAKSRKPFDLARGPLFEVHVITSGRGSYALIVVHHIVFDGTSAIVLLTALAQAYRCVERGMALAAAPPSAPYADFVRVEQEFLGSDRARAQLDYWRGRLGGDLPALYLPFDRPRPARRTFAGATHRIALASDLAAAARRLAKALRVNLSALFLGVFILLLHRYSGATDIVVVMPTANRPERRFERSIGYFVNMLAIRSRIAGDESAGDILKALDLTIADALDNADYPFPALLKELNLARDAAGRFPVLFAFQNFARPGEVGAAPFTLMPEIGQEGSHDLALEVYQDAGDFRLDFGYAADRFEAETIERMAAHYVRLLASVTDGPDSPIRGHTLLSCEERAHLLAAASGGDGATDPRHSIVDLFRDQARLAPGHTALEFEGQALTYGDLDSRSTRLAAGLSARGVAVGDRIGVIMERGLDMVVALLAILKAGAVHTPFAPDLPVRRLGELVADSGAKLLLTQDHLRSRLAFAGALTVEELDAPESAAEAGRRVGPDQPAYIIYTSGTTGAPKGVVVSHGAISHHCQVKRAIYGLEESDRVLLFAPMSVDASLDQLLPGLASGATVVVRPEALWSAREFRREVARRGLTAVDLPPAYLGEVLRSCAEDDDWSELHTLRLVVSGGEALTSETVRLWRAGPLRSARLVNAYGPTETTVDSLIFEIDENTPDDTIATEIPIGRPLPGESAYILDTYGEPTPVGVAGELHIGGAGLAVGYLDAPDLTRRRFVDHPFEPGARLYRTGDLARWRADGTIAFLGRRDAQVKVRGFRVELGEIEAVLLGLEGVGQAVVLARPVDGVEQLVAFVVGGDGRDLEHDLSAVLPRHMIPARVVALDAIPLTPGGKADRVALRHMLLDIRKECAGEEPRTDTEVRLAYIWEQLFQRKPIGLHDNFFDLGGHSLLAMRLVGLVRTELEKDISIATLLEAPDIESLARRLDTVGGDGPLVRLQAGGDTVPLFLVPPAAGHALCYRELARHMPTRSIYGLRAVGPARGIEAVAADHVAAIRAVQPCGPYRLGGWSFGGVVAYEMAHQLCSAGEIVTHLALIDSYTPSALRAHEDAHRETTGDDHELMLLLAFATELGLAETEARRHLGTGVSLESLLATALPPDIDAAELRRLFRLFEAHAAAMDRYVPRPLDSDRVGLFKATDGPRGDGGWSSLLRCLTIVAVPGDHYGLLRAPAVRLLAEKLESFLDDER